MITVVLVSHGGLGGELLACAESVVGKQSAVHVLGLGPGDSPETFEQRVRAILADVGGPGALVLSDMMGGTPCNVCLRLSRDPRYILEMVTGVNLPMLITALANRHYMPLSQLAQKLVDDAPRSAQRPLQKLREHLA